jgi:hypothetical protein
LDDGDEHRIRLLSNRCACYLRERHAALALGDTGVFLSLNELSFILQSSKATAGKILFRCLSTHLHLGLFDEVSDILASHKFGVDLVGGENLVSMAILERELIRLKDEAVYERYNIQEVLRQQLDKNSAFTFIDLSRHHAECNRTDLFEVRSCPVSERETGEHVGCSPFE